MYREGYIYIYITDSKIDISSRPKSMSSEPATATSFRHVSAEIIVRLALARGRHPEHFLWLRSRHRLEQGTFSQHQERVIWFERLAI